MCLAYFSLGFILSGSHLILIPHCYLGLPPPPFVCFVALRQIGTLREPPPRNLPCAILSFRNAASRAWIHCLFLTGRKLLCKSESTIVEWAFGNVMFQTVDRNSFLELTRLTERMFYLYTNGEKMMTEQAGLKIGELNTWKIFYMCFFGS